MNAVSKVEEFNVSASSLNSLAFEAKKAAHEEMSMFETRIHWNGLRSMVESAMADFASKTGHGLPWNLAGPSWAGYRNEEGKLAKSLRFEEAEKIVEEFARFAGWLRAAAELPGLSAAILQATDWGMGCPKTINLWHVFRRFPSPGRLNRLIFAVAEKSARILKPYGIRAVWYGSVLKGLMAHSPKKAHLWVAAQALPVQKRRLLETLAANHGHARWVGLQPAARSLALRRVEDGESPTLAEAVDWAVVNLVEDKSDGVWLMLDLSTRETVHGIEVTKGYRRQPLKKEPVFLCRQVATGRTFHVEGEYAYQNGRYVAHTLKFCAKAALSAWNMQSRLEREKRLEEAALRAKLDPSDRSILVVREDSYRAGNCQAGTEAWMEENGYRGWYVKAVDLIAFREDRRVDNILRLLMA